MIFMPSTDFVMENTISLQIIITSISLKDIPIRPQSTRHHILDVIPDIVHHGATKNKM